MPVTSTSSGMGNEKPAPSFGALKPGSSIALSPDGEKIRVSPPSSENADPMLTSRLDVGSLVHSLATRFL